MTNYELVKNCRKMANAKTVYMWGCYGQKLTETLIAKKAAQYPNRFSAARRKYLKKLVSDGDVYACDCAGLIKNFLWGGFRRSLRYDPNTDFGSESFRRAAKKIGKISTLPEIPGLGVYKKNHVGVYVGKGKVIECTLGARGDGVVETDVSDAAWKEWFFIPNIVYPETCRKKKKNTTPIIKFLRKNDIL
jgi:hypothetical protein